MLCVCGKSEQCDRFGACQRAMSGNQQGSVARFGVTSRSKRGGDPITCSRPRRRALICSVRLGGSISPCCHCAAKLSRYCLKRGPSCRIVRQTPLRQPLHETRCRCRQATAAVSTVRDAAATCGLDVDIRVECLHNAGPAQCRNTLRAAEGFLVAANVSLVPGRRAARRAER